MSKKVYCRDCKYSRKIYGEEAYAPYYCVKFKQWKDTPYSPMRINRMCDTDNIHNTCPHYEQKRKFWR